MVDSNNIEGRTISKSELASKFGIHPETLRRWIKNNEELSKSLAEIGYNKNRNLFFPNEMKLIRKYIGY